MLQLISYLIYISAKTNVNICYSPSSISFTNSNAIQHIIINIIINNRNGINNRNSINISSRLLNILNISSNLNSGCSFIPTISALQIGHFLLVNFLIQSKQNICPQGLI